MIKKILISQPRPQVERNPYADLQANCEVQCDFVPLTHVEGISAREFRDQHIYLENYTAIIFNSRLAIDNFFHLSEELRFAVPESMHYYCISEAVGNYLQKYIQYRKRKVFAAEDNRFESLLPAMNRRPNEKYLAVMSETHNDDLVNLFAAHKIEVQPAVMYRTVASEWPKDLPFDYDMVALFTPLGAQSLHQNFPQLDTRKVRLATFGANTAAAIRELGWEPAVLAPTPECPSITKAIENYLNR